MQDKIKALLERDFVDCAEGPEDGLVNTLMKSWVMAAFFLPICAISTPIAGKSLTI